MTHRGHGDRTLVANFSAGSTITTTASPLTGGTAAFVAYVARETNPAFTATQFALFSSLGLPGLNGFIGEFLILVGAFRVGWWWGAFAVTGIVLGAAYMLWLYQRTMFGEITKEENKTLSDLNAREIAFRAAIDAASLSFDRGISTAADMIREAARNKRFLAALRHDPVPALGQLAAAIESTNTPPSVP